MGYINILVSEVYAHANDKRSHKISAPENHEELKGRLYFKEKERERERETKWKFTSETFQSFTYGYCELVVRHV